MDEAELLIKYYLKNDNERESIRNQAILEHGFKKIVVYQKNRFN